MNDSDLRKVTQRNRILHYLRIGSKPGKIPELDGLRAIAILLVLFHHFATFYRERYGSYFRNLLPDGINNFLFNAWLGVDLFFVLSGYLICHHLLTVQNQPNKAQNYGRYAIKRVLRTFPLYYAIILLIGIGAIPYYPSSITWSEYLIHLTFLQDYFGAHILTPLWSLATEEKFYLLAPFLMLLLNRTSLTKGMLLLMAFIIVMVVIKTVLVTQPDQALNHISFFEQFRAPFHYAVGSILVGVMVALMAQLRTPGWLQKLALMASVLSVVILLLADLYKPSDWSWLNILHLLLVLMFGVVIWAAVKNSGAASMRFLCGRTLRIISVLSYALYLAHYTVLPWVYRLHRKYIYSEEAWVHAGSFVVMYVVAAVLFSLLLHYCVEKPFLIIKDRI